VFEPRARGPAFGVYYLWYFGGMPVLLALAGLLRDRTGLATTSIVFAICLLLCCVALAVVFRLIQVQQCKSAIELIP
jgi:hypothetical protein